MPEQFYGDVLPEAGYYCLTLLPSGQHIWAESLEELTALTEKHTERQGLYFGTAAFRSFANRKQSNVLSLKALRLDIDAGPEKLAKHGEGAVYASQADALKACVAFFAAAKLPPTYIVSSGAGLHIYFCLAEAVDPDTWKQLAVGLSAVGRQHKLKIDPSVTEDSARILRVPGAPHPNGNRVQVLRRLPKFYTVDELRGLLKAPEARKYDTSINDDLVSSGYQGPPSSAVKVAQHCGALREVAESRGDVQEPLWRAMIGLVKRTVEGLDIAHEWSDGYDGYNPVEVERKFHAWTTGPTTCSEFSKHSSVCEGCPHRGKIKSPISLGLMTTEEIRELPDEDQVVIQPPLPLPATGKPWDGHLPAGFVVDEEHYKRPTLVMQMLTEKESPTGAMVPAIIPVPFTHSIFWFGQWSEAEDSDDSALVTVHLWAGTHIKRYTMEQSLVASPAKLMEYLSGKAIHTTTHKRAAQAMQDYAKAQLQHIYTARKNVKVTDRLGLRTLDSGELVCIHGKYAIFPDGAIRETMMSPMLRPLAAAFPIPVPSDGSDTWSPDVWDTHIAPRAKQHVEFLRKYYGAEGMERFQLAIMLCLASPLMAFVTGEYSGGAALPINSSLNVSLYSRETSRGKTTCAQSAVLAYGLSGALVKDTGKAGATVNGRLGRLSLHGTMPSVMDEMSDLAPTEVATTVSSVANGTGKVTMTNNRVMRQEATWTLINIITTNVSQRDMVAVARTTPEPVLYRLLEIDVDGMPEYSAELRAAHREDWTAVTRDCTGALGAMIHREICSIGLDGMMRLTTRCVTKAEALVGANQSARFQSRGLGALLAVEALLQRIGLSIFPLPPVVREFKRAHDANVEYVAENVLPTEPLKVLARALLDLAPYTVVTHDEPNTGSKNVQRVLNARVPEIVKGRHIRSSGVTYLATSALKEWCLEHNISERPLIAAARKEHVLIPRVRGTQGGVPVSRSSGPKALTKGMEGDMHLSCEAYTFNVRRLNQIIQLSSSGFELIEGGAGEGQEVPQSDELEATGTEA